MLNEGERRNRRGKILLRYLSSSILSHFLTALQFFVFTSSHCTLCHFRGTVIPRIQQAMQSDFLSSLPNTSSDKGVVWTLNQWRKVSSNGCTTIRGYTAVPTPTRVSLLWTSVDFLVPSFQGCLVATSSQPRCLTPADVVCPSSNSFLSHRIGFCCLQPRSPSHFIPFKSHSNDTRERLLESKLGNRVASVIRKFRGNYLVTKEILSGRKGRVVKIGILYFTCFYHEALLVIWPFTRVGWEKWLYVPYKWINRANYFKP